MDNVEMAQDSLEHAHGHDLHGHDAQGHDAHGHGPAAAGPNGAARLTRFAAVLVAMIAAMAVVLEMSANDRQTAYLAHDVAASDLWSQYQGKSVRHTVLQQTAVLLDAEAGRDGADAARAIQAAAEARAAAAKLEDDSGAGHGGHDGMRQVAARATAEEAARDRALELHEKYERSVRGLQISIVLIGLFMATRLGWLLVAGSALGGVALLYGVLTALGAA